jgi:UDP-GlcNAc:undecaprenyl-phosphate/decaprenyl-phosphate GlcNAc-1-phosphate transferase
MYTVLVGFMTAACITCIATPFVIKLAKKMNWIDDPAVRYHPAQVHSSPIPRAGGIALCVGIVAALLVFVPPSPLLYALIASLVLLTIVGVLDDKKDIHPAIRLVTNAVAVLSLIAAGVSVPYITNPIGPDVLRLDFFTVTLGEFTIAPLAIIAAFIWIYWTMNVIGWSAGVDGQLPGVTAIAAIIIGILSLRFAHTDNNVIIVAVISAITAGAFVGFLPWNFYPQKIMPGYGGKTIAGFLLGMLGILSYAKLGTALLVLGIPMIDAFFTLSRRILSGKSPLWADRGHLHHHLLDLGWSKRTVALFYYLLSAILGLIALTVSSRQKVLFFFIFSLILGGFLLWANWLYLSSKRRARGNGSKM